MEQTVVLMEAEVAVVTERAVDRLITELILKADGEIAAALVAVGLDAVEAVFQEEGIVAPVAVLAFGQMVADAVLAAVLVDA